MRHPDRQKRTDCRGFSLVELLVVLAVICIVLAFSLPMFVSQRRLYRMMNDARTLASGLTEARARAASDFTRSSINVNTANGTYQKFLWNKTTSAFDIAEGGTQFLSQGQSFSFGSISTPAGSQATIQESTQVIFNSRGNPVTTAGQATGNYAIYLSNGNGQYSAVSVSASGKVSVWRWTGSAWQAY